MRSTLRKVFSKTESFPSSKSEVGESESVYFLKLFFIAGYGISIFFVLRDLLPASYQEACEFLVAPFLVISLVVIEICFLKRNEREPVQHLSIRNLGIMSVGCAILITLSIASVQPWSRISRLATYDYLWEGFGVRIAIVMLVVAAAFLISTSIRTRFDYERTILKFKKYVNVIFLPISLIMYLPSLIQPSNGIINLGDASYIVLEETVGPLVGKFPGLNFLNLYTSVLGLPLLVFDAFDLSPKLIMDFVIIYMNVLTVLVPVILVLIIRSFMRRVPLGVIVLSTLAILQVSGRWGSASAMSESWSRIPGRTLLPLLVFLILNSLSTERYVNQWRMRTLLLGCVSMLALLNNLEFGAPACLASFIVLCLITARNRFKSIMFAILGASMCLIVYSILALLSLSDIDLRYRFAIFISRGFNTAQFKLPVISSLNLCVALLFAASALGIRTILVKGASAPLSVEKKKAAITASFFGLWGLFSFSYFASGSTGASQLIFIFVIPVCASVLVLCRGHLQKLELPNQINFLRTFVLSVPFMLVMSIPFAAILQAPPAKDEIKRVLGRADVPAWSSVVDRAKADVWSSTQLDFFRADELVRIVTDLELTSKVGYFGYLGNSVEIATGIPNLTGAASLEVATSEGMKELLCLPIYRSEKKYVISMMATSLCPGLTKYREVNGWTVYVMSDN